MITRRQFTVSTAGGLAAALAPRLQARAAGEPYRVGSNFSYTGPAAFLGDRMKRSVELFVEEANKKGGVNGHPLELTLYDAGSESSKAVLAAKRLIEQDRVDVIVGDGNRSDIGLAIIPTVQRAKVPLMSVSGATALVEPVKDRPYVFKSTVNDVEVVARLLDFFKKKGVKDVAMLNDTGAFGVSARDVLKA
jgi:branched-chain amino acid transport system substrate-binding protein